MFSSNNLNEWLLYLESIHSREIDMGLTRISQVANQLDINLSSATIITVAGTNGKGTTCAFIENALLNLGHSVAVYSSPHIDVFNERLRFNKELVCDQPLIDAFQKIELARKNITLTYYEYTTLAALIIAEQRQPQYLILEVGLGGRLDATNFIDCDIAVITSIDLDHQAYLGNDRATIGLEKAGIVRANKPVIIGDLDLPEPVLSFCHDQQANVILRNSDFTVQNLDGSEGWNYQFQDRMLKALPDPKIPLDNVATGLTVVSELGFDFTAEQATKWINDTQVAGRTEIISKQPLVVLDVGHNPHAARYLNSFIVKQKKHKVHAVVAMLADKDIESTLDELTSIVDYWYVGDIATSRGADASVLANYLTKQAKTVNTFDKAVDAYKIAITNANKNDMVLIFGSFFTVAEIKKSL